MIRHLSPMTRISVKLVTPPALLVGVYLLFAGHNNPGGGFAAGLVFGAVLILRTLAEVQEPRHAREIVAFGLFAAVAVAIAPALAGGVLFDQVIGEIEVPVLGKVKGGTALPFDIAVAAIVVGLVVALLDGLAASGGIRSHHRLEHDE
ncbi:MAG: hypothetical protein OEW83_05260 [Acidimicrobiia bacterium]|nr:hypothetical protein [Acidimicrobiia bacterium]